MKSPKKKTGCLSSFISIIFLLIACGALTTISFYALIIFVFLFVIVYFFKLIVFISKKIYTYAEQKYSQRIRTGKPTFIRKLLDILYIGNLNQSDTETSDDIIISNEFQNEECEGTSNETVQNYEDIKPTGTINCESSEKKLNNAEIFITFETPATDKYRIELDQETLMIANNLIQKKQTENMFNENTLTKEISPYNLEESTEKCNALTTHKQTSTQSSEIDFSSENVIDEKTPSIHEKSATYKNPAENIQEPIKYIFPPISLLNKKNDSIAYNQGTEQHAKKLKQTLSAFKIDADIISISRSARFTRFEIQLGMGVKIRDILRIEDDIKLNLETANLHIAAPIPGRTTIGIDVENEKLSIVTLREILDSNKFKDSSSPLTVAIGKDIAGNILVKSIENMYHLLIAGTIGTGKTVCINTIIMSILYKANPNEVKLILIDTKAVDISLYNGIPHLLIPVITDIKKASPTLHWTISEMNDRYNKFATLGVKDIESYNSAVEKHSTTNESLQILPRLVVIIDDFSDLMLFYTNETEESICRLTQLGNACGIHLIISTQRPSPNVITENIKNNIPSRISFNVFSSIDSKTILGIKGAEYLLSDGDMLFCSLEDRNPLRVQGVFVSDDEITEVVDFLKNQTQQYIHIDTIEKQIANIPNNYSIGNIPDNFNSSEYDQYFIDAGRFIIGKDIASIGMIQRIFKIGFNRAARIMEQLYMAGVVGEEEGTKPRKILMNAEEFEQFVEENI